MKNYIEYRGKLINLDNITFISVTGKRLFVSYIGSADNFITFDFSSEEEVKKEYEILKNTIQTLGE